jgi:hypothetical protein
MTRIAITEPDFDAIAGTLPFGSSVYEAKTTSDGGVFVWLERRAVDQPHALRQRSEELSNRRGSASSLLGVTPSWC